VFGLHRLGVEEPVVTVHWKPAETVDDAEGWQTVQAKIAAGVPRRQALIEAGYRAEQVDAWLSGTDDAELLAAARSLLAEAQSGREWIWTAPRNAAFLGGVAALFGVVPIILGGLLGSWPLVLAGLVIGAAAIFYAVYTYRRQRWQLRALSR